MQEGQGLSHKRWLWFVLAINLLALALLSWGMLETLQRGLFPGLILVLLVAGIMIGNARAHDSARRVMRRQKSEEGGEIGPPSLD